MPQVRYVCISDLHLGAENSILTRLSPGTTDVDPTAPSACLEALVACLTDLLGNQDRASPKPSLVLNGDVLELALAPDNQGAMVFERFVEATFPSNGRALFDDRIFYVPGNHDHHVWEMARERQYARYVGGVAGELVKPPWHVTRMFPLPGEAPLEAELVTALLRDHLGRPGLIVQVAYPNLGVESGGVVVVFHHGHFVESLYRLMTHLRQSLFPGSPPGPDVWDWEADNFAWIDFFWSTLGRSGRAGEDVGLVYDMLQRGEAVGWLLSNLANTIGHRTGHPLIGRAIALATRLLARRLGPVERRLPTRPLSPGADAGLTEYVTGPLARQLGQERAHAFERPVTFVFGHTHKPFERVSRFSGYVEPVAVANTGGWVVDTLRTETVQGAAVVLVDDRGEAVSLRMYHQAQNDKAYRVAVRPIGEAGELSSAVTSLVHPDHEPWISFSRAAAAAVVERRSALGEIIEKATRRRQVAARGGEDGA
jgi:hypothetical protein